jgi:hypothetical protein
MAGQRSSLHRRMPTDVDFKQQIAIGEKPDWLAKSLISLLPRSRVVTLLGGGMGPDALMGCQ